MIVTQLNVYLNIQPYLSIRNVQSFDWKQEYQSYLIVNFNTRRSIQAKEFTHFIHLRWSWLGTFGTREHIHINVFETSLSCVGYGVDCVGVWWAVTSITTYYQKPVACVFEALKILGIHQCRDIESYCCIHGVPAGQCQQYKSTHRQRHDCKWTFGRSALAHNRSAHAHKHEIRSDVI